MHAAELHLGVGIDGFDHFRKSFQPIQGQAMKISFTPRFFSSVSTCVHNSFSSRWFVQTFRAAKAPTPSLSMFMVLPVPAKIFIAHRLRSHAMRRFGILVFVLCGRYLTTIDQLLDNPHPPHPYSA